MARTRIKICGITTVQDAACVVSAGADAIGLVFHVPSPRNISLNTAHNIAVHVGAFTTVVALFVDPDPEYVYEVLARVPVHVLQFHGKESADFCLQFNRPYIKALRMANDIDLLAQITAHENAAGLLLDSWHSEKAGGTGEVFDWSRIPVSLRQTIILAGGLNADNVQNAIKLIRPYAVDVSGGVESAPGIKDAARIAAFVANVSCADAEQVN